MVWTWRIKLWDRNQRPSCQMPWLPPRPGRKSAISLLCRSRWAAPMKVTLKENPLCTAGLTGARREAVPAAIALCLCRILTGENQRISPWKCPWHGNCFHVLRKMKSRKVLLFFVQEWVKKKSVTREKGGSCSLRKFETCFWSKRTYCYFFPPLYK